MDHERKDIRLRLSVTFLLLLQFASNIKATGEIQHSQIMSEVRREGVKNSENLADLSFICYHFRALLDNNRRVPPQHSGKLGEYWHLVSLVVLMIIDTMLV